MKKGILLILIFAFKFNISAQNNKLPAPEEYEQIVKTIKTDSLNKKGVDLVLNFGFNEDEKIKSIALKFAKALFTESINRENNISYAYRWRGQVYYMLNDYKNALFDFVEQSKLEPNLSKPLQMKGLCKIQLNDYYGAINDFSKALDKKGVEPLKSSIYLEKAFCNYKLDKIEQALIDINKSIKKDSENGRAYFIRATCNYMIDKKEKACLDYSKAGELGYTKAYSVIEKFCN